MVRPANKKSIDNDSTNNQNNNMQHIIPVFLGLLFIVTLFGMFGIVYLIDGILPTALLISDEKDNPDSFIAERAQNHLKLLTDIGPRITGSYENEVLAVEILKKEIDIIQKQAHPNQKIEVDVQIVSGSFDADRTSSIYAYGNVQNVVVKLYGDNSNNSLLVNSHFDSVPTSPGGSDDGINCATMLEVLLKLSQESERLQHNIVFLFNGAEEVPVQASHGFTTQHKWAKEVQAVVNLEAAGAGGKITLFQVGPKQPWLLNYYRKAPHLSAQAAAEELFQTGVLPSDTDFRIFRSFGNIIGLDFAFTRNGYRYHTKFDGFSNIPGGSYQYVGDVALFIVRNLGNAPELVDREKESEAPVFYDYLGLFLIHYSHTLAIVINCVVAALSLIVVCIAFYGFGLGCSKDSLLYIGLTLILILFGWCVSAASVLLIAKILDSLNFTLSWYGNPWIIFGIYAMPIAIVSCIFISLSKMCMKRKDDITVNIHVQVQVHLIRLIWTVVLLIGTAIQLRSIYFVLMPVLLQLVCFIIIHIFGWQHSKRKWVMIYLMGTIIPNLFLMQQALTIFTTLIPMCGRIGPNSNPEIVISLLTLLFTLLITSCYTPLITFLRKSILLLTILFAVCVIFFIIVFTPLGFPYSGNTESPAPQRFWIYHSSRTFRNKQNEVYKKDAGFFIYNEDRNSPDSVKDYVQDLSNVTSVEDDCYNSLFCGLPLGRNGNSKATESTWIPAEQPIFDESINLTLDSQNREENTSTFNFTASGPDRMEIYISPKLNVNLRAISLVEELPTKLLIWNDRPIYIILYTWGITNTALPFSLKFETPHSWNGPTFDIALVGRYVHDKINVKTPHYAQFVSEFPDWTDMTAFLSAYESWVY